MGGQMKTKVCLAFGMVTLGLAVVASATEYKFYEQAEKKGCGTCQWI